MTQGTIRALVDLRARSASFGKVKNEEQKLLQETTAITYTLPSKKKVTEINKEFIA